jgi:hypothetical protein
MRSNLWVAVNDLLRFEPLAGVVGNENGWSTALALLRKACPADCALRPVTFSVRRSCTSVQSASSPYMDSSRMSSDSSLTVFPSDRVRSYIRPLWRR